MFIGKEKFLKDNIMSIRKNILKKIKKYLLALIITLIWTSFVLIFLNINKKIKIILLAICIILIPATIIYLMNDGVINYKSKLSKKSQADFYKKIKKIICTCIIIISFLLYPIISIIHHISFKNSTNYGWTKVNYLPVIGDYSTKSLFDPNVIIDDTGTYRMYVSYRSKKSIAISTSTDGINWSSLEIALENNEENNWETEVNRCSVIYKDGQYYMWYTGQHNNISKIGVAISDDGYKFSRITEEPILVPEYDYEKDSVMNPYVMYDQEEQIYKMWYAAGETYEPDVIAYATSKDGISWQKYTENPIVEKGNDNNDLDMYKVGACEVYKINENNYIMFYIGYTDIKTARILFATSKDGINWRKYNKKAIINGSKFGFDSEATYKPTAIYDTENKRWMLWYNGRLVNREYIGLAVCDKWEFWLNY